jgi:hypothetical protein
MTTDSFSAKRQPSGDVIIECKEWGGATMIIPKEHCTELAEFLNPSIESVEWIPNYTHPHKVDYVRCEGEPE